MPATLVGTDIHRIPYTLETGKILPAVALHTCIYASDRSSLLVPASRITRYPRRPSRPVPSSPSPAASP